MKMIAFLISLLAPTLFWTAPPSDYAINIHVISSRFGCNGYQEINVLIDGKKYELSAPFRKSGLLTPGDYEARLVRDEHKTAYTSSRQYELLYPDKKTEKFEVNGQTE